MTQQSTLQLSLALSDNERTRPLADGRVKVQGATLFPTVVHPSEMFWRQLKYQDFDVSEMSLSSLFIATARGDRTWVALPIYTSRTFFHTNILVRNDRGITKPTDLRGKRVGVPEYQQTAALWSRGILEHEFGVKASEIEWFMERGPEKSHGGATGFKPPEGVRLSQIPATTNIGEMLVKGELDATLLYLNNKNLVDRSTVDIDTVKTVSPLFPDKRAETKRYYSKTGIYPINHTVVIKRSMYEQHPWLALNVFHGFVEAKQLVERDTLEGMQSYFDTGLVDNPAGMKEDPKSYGMKSSRKVLEMISQFVHEQGLTDRRVAVEELFAKSTMEV